jgi:hypothetical protein
VLDRMSFAVHRDPAPADGVPNGASKAHAD